jgi:outer membrane receptor protein involved in Fe transport
MDKRDTAFRSADGLTVTGGRTRHQGVEVSGDVYLSDAWTLSGWAAYAHQTYRFDSTADGIASGNDIDTAPEWTGNLRLAWEPTAALRAELEAAYVGAYFTDAANTRRYPGHTVLTLRGAWRVDDDVELFAAVRNLANTGYADRADFAFGNERYFPGAPRSLSFGLRIRS